MGTQVISMLLFLFRDCSEMKKDALFKGNLSSHTCDI